MRKKIVYIIIVIIAALNIMACGVSMSDAVATAEAGAATAGAKADSLHGE